MPCLTVRSATVVTSRWLRGGGKLFGVAELASVAKRSLMFPNLFQRKLKLRWQTSRLNKKPSDVLSASACFYTFRSSRGAFTLWQQKEMRCASDDSVTTAAPVHVVVKGPALSPILRTTKGTITSTTWKAAGYLGSTHSVKSENALHKLIYSVYASRVVEILGPRCQRLVPQL